jgi:hypothetical protein
MIHELKTHPEYFQKSIERIKKFEIRYNDRNFKFGDEIILKEYDYQLNIYTGREIYGVITYILADFIGLEKDYIAFSFSITYEFDYNDE